MNARLSVELIWQKPVSQRSPLLCRISANTRGSNVLWKRSTKMILTTFHAKGTCCCRDHYSLHERDPAIGIAVAMGCFPRSLGRRSLRQGIIRILREGPSHQAKRWSPIRVTLWVHRWLDGESRQAAISVDGEDERCYPLIGMRSRSSINFANRSERSSRAMKLNLRSAHLHRCGQKMPLRPLCTSPFTVFITHGAGNSGMCRALSSPKWLVDAAGARHPHGKCSRTVLVNP